MQLPKRIHILGASGSGTTSLGAAIAAKHGHRHLDTDDFFWVRTSPPFREQRPKEKRLELLEEARRGVSSWVLSGSLCSWGDSLVPEFELVVFLLVPQKIRMARLRAREVERYGEAIEDGGEMRRAHLEFVAWAEAYDTAGPEMRSRVTHESWLASLPCRVLRLEGDRSIAEQLARIESGVGTA